MAEIDNVAAHDVTEAAWANSVADAVNDHHHTGGVGAGTVAVAHADTSGKTATDHHAAPVAGPDADVTIDAAGAAGTASTFARSAHGHKLATSASAAAAVSTAGAAGTSGHAPSRDDHVHAHETAHVAHDTIWDAAGDLALGSGADAAAKLAKGSNYQKLEVSGAGAVGWASVHGFEGHATTQAISNNADDPIEWTEDTDTDAFHSGTSNAIVVPSGMGGWYEIAASVLFSTGGSTRSLRIQKNGADICYGQDATVGTKRTVAWLGKLAAGDSITIVALANAGSITIDAQVGMVFRGL